MKIKLLLIICLLIATQPIFADEGMWIPMLLGKYNIADMQKKGFKLTAEDIYSINKSSMKDAVMIFGGGCTAELISNEGLIITNHHCGYGNIQRHSSLEHDYLTNGFWATARTEELSNPGLTVTFLVRMDNVTAEVLKDVTPQMPEAKRSDIIEEACREIADKAIEGTHYQASVKSFYFGNEYYLFVQEVFKDVRLVGAPPSAIGNFGGDTDNWMWPRHTGDFSLFRIYADKDNKPADYSPDNIPYKPKKHFAVSLKGVKENDFTMVFGYPGITEEYLTSYAVDMNINLINPHRINIRQKKLDILTVEMDADPAIRIKYASKRVGISNGWKKWIGMNKGLRRAKAIDQKQKLEQMFVDWAAVNQERMQKYGNLLPQYKDMYNKMDDYELAMDYQYEAGYSLDIFRVPNIFYRLTKLASTTPQDEINEKVESVRRSCDGFFKDFDENIDYRLFSTILQFYYDSIPKDMRPPFFDEVDQQFGGDFQAFASLVYKNSFMTSQQKVNDFLNSFTPADVEKINNDPIYLMSDGLAYCLYYKLQPEYDKMMIQLDSLNRIYINGLREMQKDKLFYPDANSTLRVAYGKVLGYEPADGAIYHYSTTIEGIIEKDDPDIYDYRVPEKLKELYEKRDYGIYGENGQMNVCFIATNHTTGGNSGSPVIDANGNLIGINFDRCWEGTMSDMMYDPSICRNIALDIRYALFIIDKYAGATQLIKEMTLVK